MLFYQEVHAAFRYPCQREENVAIMDPVGGNDAILMQISCIMSM